jgi:hypothetical protein
MKVVFAMDAIDSWLATGPRYVHHFFLVSFWYLFMGYKYDLFLFVHLPLISDVSEVTYLSITTIIS